MHCNASRLSNVIVMLNKIDHIYRGMQQFPDLMLPAVEDWLQRYSQSAVSKSVRSLILRN